MLQIDQVSFAYSRLRRRLVFEALDWAVEPATTTLLVGPNGAGKSTLLSLLAGVERPRQGAITLDGDRRRSALYAKVGWMPQTIRAARGLTTREQLEYAAWVAGCTRRDARSLAKRGLDIVQLADKADMRADQLSGGQLRRLGLAQAAMRKSAQILLLDEPTAGLDPAQTIRFRSVLDDLDFPGGIVISTHQVADIADHVDRVAVLVKGRIIFDGTVLSFRESGRGRGVESESLSEIFLDLVGGGLD